jgi:hypothetical protein
MGDQPAGPIYPSMFNSLSLIMTTVMDFLLLGTEIRVGPVCVPVGETQGAAAACSCCSGGVCGCDI